eukprot:scaffold234911_cov14-Tisochrysis_lutea.AAC.1
MSADFALARSAGGAVLLPGRMRLCPDLWLPARLRGTLGMCACSHHERGLCWACASIQLGRIGHVHLQKSLAAAETGEVLVVAKVVR